MSVVWIIHLLCAARLACTAELHHNQTSLLQPTEMLAPLCTDFFLTIAALIKKRVRMMGQAGDMH